MTVEQEDLLYEFLSERLEPFSLKEASAALRPEKKGFSQRGLALEIENLIRVHRLAFPLAGNTDKPGKTGAAKRWISRAGCFNKARFIIKPGRAEIENGILIPGHRCVPFANPVMPPHEFKFFYRGEELPKTDTEAAPEELYPYYSVYGEEFAPQFIARENPGNEEAFNIDPYEEPGEVSVKTVDMRRFYRGSAFVPGDMLAVSILDWESSSFQIERLPANSFDAKGLAEWQRCAEEALLKSFETLGVDFSQEEQIAWAYFLGGARMMELPAYSMEEFLFEKTDKIETTPFGIESRLWYTGREIPDYDRIHGIQTQNDQTPIEKMLFACNIPISEFVIQSYVKDAFFRKNTDIADIVFRISPQSVRMGRWNLEVLAHYVMETLAEFEGSYSVFTDAKTGPLRQRLAELHTAVIELAARLQNGAINPAWLPRHTFITLSQIQRHTAGILEEIDSEEELSPADITAIENSTDNMVDTYDEIKELVGRALDNYRQSNITLVKKDDNKNPGWRIIQIGIGGTEVWRRLIVPQNITLEGLHRLIQALFNWSGRGAHKFLSEYKIQNNFLDGEGNLIPDVMLGQLASGGFSELVYEYNRVWNVRIIILSVYAAKEGEKIACISGENAIPPETVDGPLRYRRYVNALGSGNEIERKNAEAALGASFDPEAFSLPDCNKKIEDPQRYITGS